MHVKFTTSDSTDKLRAACYDYLMQKYGGVQRDRSIREGIDRGTGETWVQPNGSVEEMPGKGSVE
ncbi:hypothetical protein [Paenibacillus polymyxa]|uniref:hypothetical protein n=1 Tax=Paenibacillus polymyxa TaxID=1406 RepID=UPI001E5ACA69|nr:hypothetical protein [Paenibacillus polymyxa]MCJ1222289.1 hypothetical protein [Paenibacillus polymyxa]